VSPDLAAAPPGYARFGDENALAGAVLLSFTLDELQRLDGTEGSIRWIDVSAGADVTTEALLERLEAALPADIEAVSGDVVIAEGQDDFGDIVAIFGNTFNILLGQRVR
jgi:hypothetical protein